MKRSHSVGKRLITLGIAFGLVLTASSVRAQPCAPAGDPGEGAPLAARTSNFMNAWILKYPTSTLPARMNSLTGRNCNVCHHPPNFSTQGNCYRDDITVLMNQGMTIEQALNQLDAADSDGDGVSNGVEALAPRPEVGEIGYNPGLIGPLGTDPCGANPGATVTGVSETPVGPPVPAVSDWGMVTLVLLLVTGASIVLRKRASCA